MPQQAPSADLKRARGRSIHRGTRTLPPVPIQWSSARTALNIAAQTLFPWPAETYPGIAAGMVTALGPRAKTDAVRNWRNGRRQAPVWAIKTTLSELERRRQAIEHAEALLRAELEKRNANR